MENPEGDHHRRDEDHEVPPPAYGGRYGHIESEQSGLATRAEITSDGRIDIRFDKRSRQIADLLGPVLHKHAKLVSEEPSPPPAYILPSLGGNPDEAPPPSMNVVIHVVGSRGDVQPFIALGKVLKETYRHRVRLATHPVFKDFVEENGLEFFTIGGDPSELMAFMVKNPGLMPGFDTLRNGDVGKRRKGIAEMIQGCWRSCFEAGDGFGVAVSDNTVENWAAADGGGSFGAETAARPFVADAIIANPPSFAHVHCAEKLGVPLHMMFTMPWSPTQAFPHPLAVIRSSNADTSMANFISYALVDMMTWQGLGDVVNRFRHRSLGLEPISLVWAPGMIERLRVPFTYCWSPALIPKPKDWGSHISISGFYFLSLASNFHPDEDLLSFLDNGPPPVYIGFGSIVVDDPNAMTRLIFEAVEKTGQRALVSKGWGGFGADQLGKPEQVFMLGNVPHDWLFKHVSCVVHHGGAGTSAAGIAAGKPTVVVPFFGDQPFWGAMIARAGAGPKPVPYKHLTADILANAIIEALKPQTLERAKNLSTKISREKGSDVGAQSFHQFLDVDKLRCSLAPSRIAVWRIKRTQVGLSALAATVLGNEGLLDFSELKMYRAREYNTGIDPWDPITGGAGALIGTLGSMMMGVADMPVETLKALKIHPEAAKGKSDVDPASQSMHNSSDNPTPEEKLSPKRSASPSWSPDMPRNVKEPDSYSVHEASVHDTSSREAPEPLLTTPTATPTSVHGPLGHEFSSLAAGRSSTSRPTSRSGSRHNDQQSVSQHRSGSHHAAETFNLESALHTGKGVSRIVGAGIKSPMDFTLALAKGFHNAPRLYGDKSVRHPERITGFQSGLLAATKGFGYGVYDGITGLVTQPMEGAKAEGGAGFLKGVGKGIGGLILKPGAAFWGIPGYTMMGVYKEMQKFLGPGAENYMIAARTAQGFEDFSQSSPEERQDIVNRWRHLQKTLKKKTNFGEEQLKALRDQAAKDHALFRTISARRNKDDRHQSDRQESLHQTMSFSQLLSDRHHDRSDLATSPPPMPLTATVTPQRSHESTTESWDAAADEDHDLEEAIRQSVAQTSRGDAEEDERIEQAIRASLEELSTAGGRSYAEDAILRRVIEGSRLEGDGTPLPSYNEALGTALVGDAEKDGTHLHEERAKSELNRGPALHTAEYAIGLADDDSGVDTEDDENVKAAIANSEEPLADVTDGDGGSLNKALEESQRIWKDEKDREQREKREEDVVMEYVKRQSLAEEEYRTRMVKGKGKEGV